MRARAPRLWPAERTKSHFEPRKAHRASRGSVEGSREPRGAQNAFEGPKAQASESEKEDEDEEEEEETACRGSAGRVYMERARTVVGRPSGEIAARAARANWRSR